jgi:hypothetical protein
MSPLSIPLLAEFSKVQEQLLLPLILKFSRLPEQCRVQSDASGGLGHPFKDIYERCRDFTLTPLDAMYAMYQAAEYVVRAQVPGDVVECGVWKAGSSMIVALAFRYLAFTEPSFYLYDTFEGMPETEARDQNFGNPAFHMAMQFAALLRGGSSAFFYAPLDEARANMQSTGYPPEKTIFVKGRVEQTLPGQMPRRISILHLDSDLYRSTYHSLTHLFPSLSPGGVLIVDDYDSWKGSREATDQYFQENGVSMLLLRIGDSGARIGIKPSTQAVQHKRITHAESQHL